MVGFKHSLGSREKMRQAHLGQKLSEEHKAKIGAAGLGREHTAETRAKLSASARADWKRRRIEGGKVKHTAETKAKMRRSRLAYLASQKGLE